MSTVWESWGCACTKWLKVERSACRLHVFLCLFVERGKCGLSMWRVEIGQAGVSDSLMMMMMMMMAIMEDGGLKMKR